MILSPASFLGFILTGSFFYIEEVCYLKNGDLLLILLKEMIILWLFVEFAKNFKPPCNLENDYLVVVDFFCLCTCRLVLVDFDFSYRI